MHEVAATAVTTSRIALNGFFCRSLTQIVDFCGLILVIICVLIDVQTRQAFPAGKNGFTHVGEAVTVVLRIKRVGVCLVCTRLVVESTEIDLLVTRAIRTDVKLCLQVTTTVVATECRRTVNVFLQLKGFSTIVLLHTVVQASVRVASREAAFVVAARAVAMFPNILALVVFLCHFHFRVGIQEFPHVNGVFTCAFSAAGPFTQGEENHALLNQAIVIRTLSVSLILLSELLVIICLLVSVSVSISISVPTFSSSSFFLIGHQKGTAAIVLNV
mmetsp:Transcript_133/g.226  ORF Transcript_133/g.226 Transcript_133/m.226 type:complete len:273 (-) Transcript_133:190-1008(-)